MTKKQAKLVQSETHMKATAKLEAEVQEELKIPDPSPEKAKAILQNAENINDGQHQ